MRLDIILEKLEDDVVVPFDSSTGLQIRHDGILVNGELHLWEEIMFIQITNRELLDKLKRGKSNA